MTALRHEHDSWSFLPLSPWGRGRVSSVHWAHHGMSYSRAVRAVRFPVGTAGVLRAHHTGLGAAAKLGGRCRLAAVEPSC
jgi:hypothetical protein